jgi:hypothetical protein
LRGCNPDESPHMSPKISRKNACSRTIRSYA